MRTSLAVLAALVLLGCAPRVPDSGAGVGFDSYTEYQRQQARLAGTRALGDRPAGPATAAPIPPPAAAPPPVALPAAGAQGAQGAGGAITASDLAAAGIGTAAGGAPAAAPAAAPPAAAPAGGAGAGAGVGAGVGGAAPVIPPVPERTGTAGPNIAAFALSTSHPVGQQMWRRTNLGGQGAAARACARYASPALAQEAFLARGGPERDPLGLDPDGDGYVCGWDPTPFRLARGS